MAKKKKIWKNKDGNICFRYKHHSKWWIIPSIVMMILISVCAIEYLMLDSYTAIIPSILCCLIVTYGCSTVAERKEDKAMLSMLGKALTALVNKEMAKRKDVHEVRRKLFCKCKGTYGVIESRSVLILLSDKTILEYPILWNGGNDEHYELLTHGLICTDSERTKFIRPHALKDVIDGFSISDDNKLRIVLFGLMFVSLSILIVLIWLFSKFKQNALTYLMFYVGIFVAFHIMQHFVKKRVFSVVVEIISLPLVLIKLVQPIMTIVVAFIGVPFLISACTMLALLGIGHFRITLEHQTMAIASLTLTAILCVHSRKFTQWMIMHSPLKDKGNHRYEKFSEILAIYVTEPQNYNFLFSLLYVVFLLLSAFYNIEYGTYLINKEADFVIMKSFLVFLAFNTMMQRSHETDINTKDLLVKVLGLFEHDDK